jgi:hypothetical protein
LTALGGWHKVTTMLRHVVLFRMRPDVAQDAVNALVAGLRALDGQIAELRSLEVGVDVLRSKRTYDIALVSTFDDLEALARYSSHPAHLEVADEAKRLAESVVAVDFFVPE